MHNSLLRLFALLLTLVMMPVEVIASIAESNQRNHAANGQFTVLKHQIGPTAQETIQHEESDSSPLPVSESHFKTDAAGILNAGRWNVSQREENASDTTPLMFGDGHASPDALPNVHVNVVCAIARKALQTQYHYVANHRLAGWKETNAMYVALNSQFS
ncbi:hypothetical protein OTE47_000415 [Vibrio vulnificus]|nr:hypothetical protein [Vibrio vulnificus]EIV8490154.1 hypothetical protein [Vibrio vulnificus]EIZ1280698.1 hypothetical protein [Vibrio vulnificus]EIZ1284715.1 hypothetical protein [Vibrio vulnificus]EKE1117194.1 hypothetical protein [Vibrio vulnificus]